MKKLILLFLLSSCCNLIMLNPKQVIAKHLVAFPLVHADFKLYPNPATSYSSLAYQTNSNSKTFSLSIYNTQGQLIKRMELSKNRDEIVIASDQFVPGLYLVQLRDENGLILGSGKLVKK
ncbi:MAG: T9SS type A sorting domain-containing protein [Bacteroidia bacterium]